MKTVSSLIIDELNQILKLIMVFVTILVMSYSFYSVHSSKNKAEELILNHVSNISESSLNEQDILAIEKDLSRFVSTWSKTQDLNFRIEIRVDGKLVGRAGPLAPFEWLASDIKKSKNLPSGKILEINAQISELSLILSLLAFLIVLELSLFGVFWYLKQRIKASASQITKPLEDTVAWLNNVAQNLPQSAHQTSENTTADIQEIITLSKSIRALMGQVVQLERHLAEVNFDKGRVKMAEQVAHNIKGAIATMELKVNSLTITSAEKMNLLASIHSMREVTRNLLTSRKTMDLKPLELASSSRASATQIFPLVHKVVEEKQYQYSQSGYDIRGPNPENVFDLFGCVDPIELKNILNNLIDNAVEALDKSYGQVTVTLSRTHDHFVIGVADNGKGIDSSLVPEILNKGISVGKVGGAGVGLPHAKEYVELWNGKVDIQSHPGFGTMVTLRLPRAEPIIWIPTTLSISSESVVIIMDDDQSVHGSWDLLFKNRSVQPQTVIHLSSINDFEAWMRVHGHGKFGERIYLMDFELKGENKNGLDAIENAGIALESVLVTGRADDKTVIERANEIGTKILSKDFIWAIPLQSTPKNQTTIEALAITNA